METAWTGQYPCPVGLMVLASQRCPGGLGGSTGRRGFEPCLLISSFYMPWKLRLVLSL